MGQTLSTSDLVEHVRTDLGLESSCEVFPLFSSSSDGGTFAAVEVFARDISSPVLRAALQRVAALSANGSPSSASTAPQPDSQVLRFSVQVLSRSGHAFESSAAYESVSEQMVQSADGDAGSSQLDAYVDELREMYGGWHARQLNLLPSRAPSQNRTWIRKQLASKQDVVATCVTALFPNVKRLKSTPRDKMLPLIAELPSRVSPLSGGQHAASLLSVDILLESPRAFFLISPYFPLSVDDLITYNLGGLNTSSTYKLFLLYQALKGLEAAHRNGVTHGRITAQHLLVDDRLWVRLCGLRSIAPGDRHVATRRAPLLLYREPRVSLTELWINGDVSNFHYLMAINRAAGRREGDSNFHPALPWVIDFAASASASGADGGEIIFRDLSKSKFRLNKGDEQLDITYSTGPHPHHIIDILTDITYYVYMARRTPVAVLTRHVRAKYEPHEYPSSIARMYQWSPDECIPAFFTDPTVFCSIHSDMPDLQLPRWASSPQDFVQKHMEALESDVVSHRLHHWIDLTFGCKLTGRAAVDAKNVPLSPAQTGRVGEPLRRGLVQLFRSPHPSRSAYSHGNVRSGSISMGLPRGKPAPEEDEVKSAGPAAVSSSSGALFVDKMTNLLLLPLPDEMRRVLSDQRGSPPPAGGAAAGGLVRRTTNPSPSASPSSSSLASASAQRKFSGDPRVNLRLPSASLSPMRQVTSSINDDDEGLPTPVSSVESANVPAESFAPNQGDSLADSLTTAFAHVSMPPADVSQTVTLPLSVTPESLICKVEHFEETAAFSRAFSVLDARATTGTAPSLPSLRAFMSKRQAVASLSAAKASSNQAASALLDEALQRTNERRNEWSFEERVASDVRDVLSIALRLFQRDATTGSPTSMADVPSRLAATCLRASLPKENLAHWTATAMLAPEAGLGFPSHFGWMYEFLAKFQMSDWKERLAFADTYITEICELPDPSFHLMLAHLAQLFHEPSIRCQSLVLFDRLCSRLGVVRSQELFKKPVQAMFETYDADTYAHLLRPQILDSFLLRFGVRFGLKQLLPFILDCLTMKEPPTTTAPVNVASFAATGSSPFAMFGNIWRESETTDYDAASDVEATSISHLCSMALTSIATLIGPVLCVRYITPALLRKQIGENASSQQLHHTLVAIGGLFGDVFITSHIMPFLINAVEGHVKKPTGRTPLIVATILSVLQRFAVQLPAEAVIGLLAGQLGEVLHTLMQTLPLSDKLSVEERRGILKNTLSLLVYISHAIPRADWEAHILPMLQSYFASYDHIHAAAVGAKQPLTVFTGTPARAIYSPVLASYAYSQFCLLIGQESMRRYVPNNELIEKIMYDHIDGEANAAAATGAPELDQEVPEEVDWSVPPDASVLALHDEVIPVAEPAMLPSALSIAPSAVDSLETGETVFMQSWFVSPDEQLDDAARARSSSAKGSPARTSMSSGSSSTATPASSASSTSFWRSKSAAVAAAAATAAMAEHRNWREYFQMQLRHKQKTSHYSFNEHRIHSYHGHTGGVRQLDAALCERVGLSGGRDRTIKIWSLDAHGHGLHPQQLQQTQVLQAQYRMQGGGCLRTYNGHRKNITDAFFFADATQVVSSDGNIHYWETESGHVLQQFEAPKGFTYSSVVAAEHSKTLVAASQQLYVQLFDLRQRSLRHTLRTSVGIPNGAIRSLALPPPSSSSASSPSGAGQNQHQLAVGLSAGHLSTIDLRTGAVLGQWRVPQTTADVSHLSYLPDGRLLAIAGDTLSVADPKRHSAESLLKAGGEIVAFCTYKSMVIAVDASNALHITTVPSAANQPEKAKVTTVKLKSTAAGIKSNVTALQFLPLNRLVWFGCDDGQVLLYH